MNDSPALSRITVILGDNGDNGINPMKKWKYGYQREWISPAD